MATIIIDAPFLNEFDADQISKKVQDFIKQETGENCDVRVSGWPPKVN